MLIMSKINAHFNEKEQEFSIGIGSISLFNHSKKSPLIILHKVEPIFKTHKRSISNYRIKNKPIMQYPLYNFHVKENKPHYISIIFEDALEIDFLADEKGYIFIGIHPIEKFDKKYEKINRFEIRIAAEPQEAIFGCGEQFSYLNMRGRKVPMWTQEPGFAKNHSIYKYFGDAFAWAGGEWWTNYYPQPIFVSSNHYFCSVESYAFCEFDFTNKSYHRLLINEIPNKMAIGVGDTPLKVLDLLSSYLEKQRALPEWIIDGAILGIGGGLDPKNPDNIVHKIESAKRGNVKIAAIWAEDWSGIRQFKAQTRLFWNWKYSKELYPNLPEYINQLRAEGIRFLGYNNCFLMYDSELYEEAKEKGYLIKDKEGKPYDLKMYTFSAVMLDLTNPDCCSWFKSIIKDHMIDAGLDGWMCDFAEYLPVDSVNFIGKDPHLLHNEYPVLWAKVNNEAIIEANRHQDEDAIIFFSRSGNFGTTKYSPLIWTGDQVMTFWMDMGLPAQINACISMGFSGVGQIHGDIAGEFGLLWFKRSKELFMRWAEFCAFTPVMRTHEAKGLSGWTYDNDEETLAHFAKYSRIHSNLKEYIMNAIREYQESGLPIMRAPYIHYFEDPVFQCKKRDVQYEYLLGRDILVAPVIKKGAKARKLYLPKENWIHVWTEAEYEGGWITVNAPIGQIPVFLRKNAVNVKELLRSIKEESIN